MKILISHISDDITFFDFTGKKEDFNIPMLSKDVQVDISIYHSGGSYTSSGTIKTGFKLTCDRCLGKYDFDINTSFNVIFTSEEDTVKDDHLMFLSPQDVEINFMPYVRETLILNIPFKKLCSTECKGLCAKCGVNLNYELCSCKREQYDPRWNKLKELKKSLENAEE